MPLLSKGLRIKLQYEDPEIRTKVGRIRDAIKKKRKHGSTLTLSEMAFGYQESSRGYFRRFHIFYNEESDSVSVDTQP